VSFVGTFGLAPIFKSSFKEDADWQVRHHMGAQNRSLAFQAPQPGQSEQHTGGCAAPAAVIVGGNRLG
jgi:hypothetical protein